MAIYNGEENFMKKSFATRSEKVTSDKMILVFENLPAGDFGISTFHDVNHNEKLDTNFLGIPTERYGFSNNARGSFGPPSFNKAKVKVSDNVKISINVH